MSDNEILSDAALLAFKKEAEYRRRGNFHDNAPRYVPIQAEELLALIARLERAEQKNEEARKTIVALEKRLEIDYSDNSDRIDHLELANSLLAQKNFKLTKEAIDWKSAAERLGRERDGKSAQIEGLKRDLVVKDCQIDTLASEASQLRAEIHDLKQWLNKEAEIREAHYQARDKAEKLAALAIKCLEGAPDNPIETYEDPWEYGPQFRVSKTYIDWYHSPARQNLLKGVK